MIAVICMPLYKPKQPAASIHCAIVAPPEGMADMRKLVSYCDERAIAFFFPPILLTIVLIIRITQASGGEHRRNLKTMR